MNDIKINKLESEISDLKKNDYSVLDSQHGFMVDGLLGGFKASIHKMHYTFFRQILLGILSGVIIGFGYAACIVAISALPFGSGFANVVLGIIFPGCIILITYLGGGLFTSHVVATIPMFKKTVKISDYFKGIFGVLLGNWIGTLIFLIFFAMAGGLTMKVGGISVFAQSYFMAIHKLYGVGEAIFHGQSIGFWVVCATILAGFASGILCNFMVSSTLPLTNSSKHAVLAIMVLLFPILFFALSGYQHSPANSYFMWVIFITNIFRDTIFSGDISTVFGSGEDAIEAAQYAYNSVNWNVGFIFFFVNLIPSLLGNWLSGSIFLPGILYLINKKYVSVFFQRERLLFLQYELKIATGKIQPNVKRTTNPKSKSARME